MCIVSVATPRFEQKRPSLTAKRLRPPAQGCRFGYPGITGENESSTATRLRHLVRFQIRRNRVAVGINAFALPRVAEAATLGWRAQPRCGWNSAFSLLYQSN